MTEQQLEEWKREQYARGFHLSKNGSQSSTGMNAGGMSPHAAFIREVDREFERCSEAIRQRKRSEQ